MDRNIALDKMKPPGARKQGKWREGVIQIWVTRACDKSCFGCTQGSNLKPSSPENMFITVDNFEIAVKSLIGYHGVVGMFGGNPALHPEFPLLCEILSKHIPFEQRGLWCNNPMKHGKVMRETFNPAYSNLNVHLDQNAYAKFLVDWPECNPVGLTVDSRHSPVHGSMLDLATLPDPSDPTKTVPNTEDVRWHWISKCDINQHWSGMVGQFRGQPRAWFCEVAGAQAMLMQDDDTYPDTGTPLPQEIPWWQGTMDKYANQVDFHCHQCLVPLRGYGELACSESGCETTTKTYLPIFQPKRSGRSVNIIDNAEQLQAGKIQLSTNYLGNSKK